MADLNEHIPMARCAGAGLLMINIAKVLDCSRNGLPDRLRAYLDYPRETIGKSFSPDMQVDDSAYVGWLGDPSKDDKWTKRVSRVATISPVQTN